MYGTTGHVTQLHGYAVSEPASVRPNAALNVHVLTDIFSSGDHDDLWVGHDDVRSGHDDDGRGAITTGSW